MHRLIAALAITTSLNTVAGAATVYPLDRATILAQSPFDVKVEFDKVVSADQVTVTTNGQPAETVLGKKFEFLEKEEDFDASALLIRAASISQPGTYKLEAKAGDEMKSVSWQVFGTPATPKAKNVIFFLGDGLSVAHRTGARIMSKGMTEGKANGRLNMDDPRSPGLHRHVRDQCDLNR
ncbi:hypothetical protein X772_32745 [Mesorhizobium sp. LSJC280B00]|nr:hypothetical protein X772_32745 [Mesorhizobium sp. LSJC280B00]